MSKSHKIYKTITDFILNCANTCISIMKVLVLSKNPKKFPKPNGERCLVLGNGPSLNDALEKFPEYFHKHSLLCVNSFAVSDHYTTFKPTYYVILDPGFWTSKKEVVTSAMDAIRDKTTWPVYLFVPFSAGESPVISALKNHKFIKVQYFNYVVFRGFPSIAHLFYRHNRAMMQSRNVLSAAIFMAINIGFKRIEVFGADHSWHEQIHVDENNKVSIRIVHFYDNEEKVTYVPHVKGLDVTETRRVDETFDIWARTFSSYYLVEEYAKTRGCKVYNATQKSYVDAFERIKIIG